MSNKVVPLVSGTGKTADAPHLSGIPQEMTNWPQWVLHKAKVPHQPDGSKANVTNLNTLHPYDEVVSAINKGGFNGIAWVFTEDDPYCGIDLDGCRNPESGEIAGWAQAIIDKVSSFTEESLSGTGVHIIARGSVPEARKTEQIEIYCNGRAFVMTGKHIDGTPLAIEDADEVINDIWDDLIAQQGGPSGKANALPENSIDWDADPESIRDRVDDMLASDLEFRRTWEHDRPGLPDQSLSAYDMSLLSQAVLVHEWSDPTDLYLLIRLHRAEQGKPKDKKKAKRRGYICRTIGIALAGVEHENEEQAQGKVVIKIRRGRLAEATREAAAALGYAASVSPFDGIYRYGDQLVHVTRRAGIRNSKEV
jgi:putative DNA primase/helicase